MLWFVHVGDRTAHYMRAMNVSEGTMQAAARELLAVKPDVYQWTEQDVFTLAGRGVGYMAGAGDKLEPITSPASHCVENASRQDTPKPPPWWITFGRTAATLRYFGRKTIGSRSASGTTTETSNEARQPS